MRASATRASTGSRLPNGAIVEGSIRASGDLRVAGEVYGPIEVEGHLVIEATGLVRGEVRARTITIEGTLEGDAIASELVRLEAGARLTGDARADRVSAAEGARLRGRIRTSQERAQLERMRRTTGGTLLAPFSSSGGLAAPRTLEAPIAPSHDVASPQAPTAPIRDVAMPLEARPTIALERRSPPIVHDDALTPPRAFIPPIGRRRAHRRGPEPRS